MTIQAYEIPLRATPQAFLITLAGVQYSLSVKWCNANASWVMDITDVNGAGILSGVPLVTGADLLEQYAHLGIGGKLYVQSDFDLNAVPNFTNLGSTSHLYFIPIAKKTVTANDQRTLKETLLWTYRVPSGQQIYSTPVLTTLYGEPAIVFQCWDWYLYALRARDGALHWRKAFGAENYGRAQAADVNGDGLTEIFGASHDGQIHSLDQGGGNLWQFNNLYDREGTGTASAGAAGSITDATKSWAPNSFLRKQGVGFGATITITSGTGAGQSREITSVISGTQLGVTPNWTTNPDNTSHYAITPKYPSDKFYQHAGTLKQESGTWYLYVTGFDNQCVKLNATTGAIIWKFSSLENIEAFPLVMDINGDGINECVFGSLDGYVYALKGTDGSLVWKTLADAVNGQGVDAFISAADINNDGVVEVLAPVRRGGVAGGGGRVHVLRGTDGANLAQTIDSGGDIDCQAAIYNANAAGIRNFASGSDAGIVFCSDPNGNLIWKNVIGNIINASPQYNDMDNDGQKELSVFDMSGRVTILEPTKGLALGIFTVPGAVEGTPLIADINVDGLLEVVIPNLVGSVQAYQLQWS